MSWTEREGSSVSAPKQRGFVMEAMTERSAHGMVDLDYAPSGVTWRLTCPAASALEPRECEQIRAAEEKSNWQRDWQGKMPMLPKRSSR
jgi:hypothetical protein